MPVVDACVKRGGIVIHSKEIPVRGGAVHDIPKEQHVLVCPDQVTAKPGDPRICGHDVDLPALHVIGIEWRAVVELEGH